MYRYQKQELTNLRDALRRDRSQLKLAEIKDYIIDNIFDRTLLKKLNTDIAAKAIWYCLCNNNADRDALISKLYDYFIKKGLDDYDALELISMVLFLSGVDFQVNDIGQSSSSSSSLSNSNLVRHKKTSKLSAIVSKNIKWIVGTALVVVVALVVILLPKTCSDNGNTVDTSDTGVAGGANSPYRMQELCINYYGFIEEGNNKKTCVLTISDDFEVTVSNKYKEEDIQKYTAELDGDKLKLSGGGPTLNISKDNKGRIKLYYKDKHFKRWDFTSK